MNEPLLRSTKVKNESRALGTEDVEPGKPDGGKGGAGGHALGAGR
jgi:hypothetical protein